MHPLENLGCVSIVGPATVAMTAVVSVVLVGGVSNADTHSSFHSKTSSLNVTGAGVGGVDDVSGAAAAAADDDNGAGASAGSDGVGGGCGCGYTGSGGGGR